MYDELDLHRRKLVISVNYGFGGGVLTVTNAESSDCDESAKFTLKIRSESGKLFTIGCHFPSKSSNFGTLVEALIRPAGTGSSIGVLICSSGPDSFRGVLIRPAGALICPGGP